MPGVCDSCGDDVEDRWAVHRIYVAAAADGGEMHGERLSEIEHWCLPCRTHYPHEVIVAD